MAQIFHPSTNVLARISLLGVVVLPVGLLVGGSAVSRSPWNTKVGIPKDQPAPFSHEHHAVELGIDCRYCHNSVEKSPYSNLPATATCYTCHSQIWTNSPLLEPVRNSIASGAPLRWNQLHTVPDFVYFPHDVHVNRGVKCNICHGPIQKEMMTYKGRPFYMAWCLTCHRNPEEFVGERKDEFAIYKKNQTNSILQTQTPGRAGEINTTLSAEEEALLNGKDYTRNAEELQKGKELLSEYKVKKQQLADCSVCHR
jgi:hypothetical protein